MAIAEEPPINREQIVDTLQTLPLNESEIGYLTEQVLRGVDTLLATEPDASKERVAEVVDNFMSRLRENFAQESGTDYRGSGGPGGNLEHVMRKICPGLWPFC